MTTLFWGLVWYRYKKSPPAIKAKGEIIEVYLVISNLHYIEDYAARVKIEFKRFFARKVVSQVGEIICLKSIKLAVK